MEYEVLINGAGDAVDVITILTYLLFLYLIIGIFIERFIEIFISILKYTDLKFGWYKIWNKKAEKIRSKLDQLYGFQGSETEDKKRLFTWIMWQVITDQPYKGGKAVIAAKSIRTIYYRFISRIFAFVISLGFSFGIYNVLEIDLVSILNKIAGPDMSLLDGASWVIKVFITAAVLSAGSEPLHQLIKKVENVGESKKN